MEPLLRELSPANSFVSIREHTTCSKSSTRFVFGMTLFLNRASLRTIDSRQHHILLHSLSMVLLTLEMASALSLFLSMTSANQSLLPPLISILSSVFITDVLGLVPLPPQAWKYGRLTMSSHGTSRRCGWTLIQTCRLSSTTGGLCNVLTSNIYSMVTSITNNGLRSHGEFGVSK